MSNHLFQALVLNESCEPTITDNVQLSVRYMGLRLSANNLLCTGTNVLRVTLTPTLTVTSSKLSPERAWTIGNVNTIQMMTLVMALMTASLGSMMTPIGASGLLATASCVRRTGHFLAFHPLKCLSPRIICPSCSQRFCKSDIPISGTSAWMEETRTHTTTVPT